MKRVITYGTFDVLHYGHINLLKRAKALGDYLIVALSTDEFNAIKNKKSFYTYEQRKMLLEACKYVDLIIPENNWEQKIDDVQKYQADIFVMGDDWKGKFDFLKDYCEVVYLPRTPDVSSTQTKEYLKNDIKIDLVYLWVDGNDEEFQRQRNYWQEKLNIPVAKENCDCRYVENDELKYSLRSVDKHMPWVNKIFIITNGQIPKWLDLNNDKIQIIRHGDIIPKEFLPTFNSRTIESCITNIPNLSEYFLLANDDCFVNRNISPKFFFDKNNKPIVRLQKKHFTRKKMRESLYLKSIFHSINLINKIFKKKYFYMPHHNIDAYTKTDFNNCKNTFKQEFDKLLTHKFRKQSVQRIIFSLYQIEKNKLKYKVTKNYRHHRNVDSVVFDIENKDILLNKIKKSNPALFCINDAPEVNEEDRENLKLLLKQFFPNKSSWEKGE